MLHILLNVLLFLELQWNETKNALPNFMHFELREGCGSSKIGLE
jgi:hypothetical protein